MEALPEYLIFDQLAERYENVLREASLVKHKRAELLQESKLLMAQMRRIMEDPREPRKAPGKKPAAFPESRPGLREPEL